MPNEENEIDLKLILESIFRYFYIFLIVLSLSSVIFYLNIEKYKIREYTSSAKVSLADRDFRQIIFHWNRMNQIQEIFHLQVGSAYSFNMKITHVYDEYEMGDFFKYEADEYALNEYLKNYAKSNFNNIEFSSIYEYHEGGPEKEFIVKIKTGNKDISEKLSREAVAYLSKIYRSKVGDVVKSKYEHFNQRLLFYEESMNVKLDDTINNPTFFQNSFVEYEYLNGIKSGLEVLNLVKFELNETYSNLLNFIENFNLNLSKIKIDIRSYEVPFYYYIVTYLIVTFLISMCIIIAIIILTKKK